MSFFIDTSSLVKIYHKEENSQKVIDLYNSNEAIYISELAKIEFVSTAYKKYRENEIIKIADKIEPDMEMHDKQFKKQKRNAQFQPVPLIPSKLYRELFTYLWMFRRCPLLRKKH